MSDLIDRYAAIDVVGIDEEIRCEMCRNPMHTDRGCDGGCTYDEKLYKRIMQILDERIKPLPSAQPELDEWCTDCKEYDQERHCCPRWNRVIRNTLKDVERKKGKWIDEGFYADGHGAHAFRCPECGGHIIEYDADPFCKWCGADMRGDENG